MSALAVPPLVSGPAASPRGAPGRDREHDQGRSTGSADVGGEPTLDALVAGVWEGLVAHESAVCPVCGDEMRPEYGAHALPIGGRCRSCGTRLT